MITAILGFLLLLGLAALSVVGLYCVACAREVRTPRRCSAGWAIALSRPTDPGSIDPHHRHCQLELADGTSLPVWEALHHLIRVHATEGDSGAAKVLAGIARQAEPARQLAYRLYTLCERKGWAEDARAYNGVVTGWSGIEQAATRVATPEQRSLFETEETSP